MGRRRWHSHSVSDKECPAFCLCWGSFFGIFGFAAMIPAGGVGSESPFTILSTMALIIGIIGVVLSAIVIPVAFFVMNGFDEFSCCRVFYFTSRFLYGIINLISVPVGIIVGVGFLSLETSLDVLFAKPHEVEKLFDGLSNPTDWVAQTQDKMSAAGGSLIGGAALVIIPVICYLISSLRSDYKETKPLDALVLAVLQLLCGLALLLPLQGFGRTGLGVLGFAGLKDSTYTALCVLAVVVIVLATVNGVFVGVSLKLPMSVLFRILGAVQCVVSVVIMIYASIVLWERTQAEDRLQAFCTADGDGSDPSSSSSSFSSSSSSSFSSFSSSSSFSFSSSSSSSSSSHCMDLLACFQANMCVVVDAAPADEDGNTTEGEEKEGEEEEKLCADKYTMEVLQEKMLASTRGWMGFMGFSCMFVAFAHAGYSLFVSLCRQPDEPVCGDFDCWDCRNTCDCCDYCDCCAGKVHTETEPKIEIMGPFVKVWLRDQEEKTQKVVDNPILVFSKRLYFIRVRDENVEVKFDLCSNDETVMGTATVRLSEYIDMKVKGEKPMLVTLKKNDETSADVGVLEMTVEIDFDGGSRWVKFFVDKLTKS